MSGSVLTKSEHLSLIHKFRCDPPKETMADQGNLKTTIDLSAMHLHQEMSGNRFCRVQDPLLQELQHSSLINHWDA